MARLKDRQWNLACSENDESFSIDHITLALLMDIRDELKEINRKVSPLRHLDCHNFLRIPRVLDVIRRNTNKKKRTKK